MIKITNRINIEKESFDDLFEEYNKKNYEVIESVYKAKRKRGLLRRRILIVLSGISLLSLIIVASLGIGLVMGKNKSDTELAKIQQNETISFMSTSSDTTKNTLSTQTEIKPSAPINTQYSYQSEYPQLYCAIPQRRNYENKVYLTFDDGPSDLTVANLDTLKGANVKATFFVVGAYVEKRKDILKRMVDDGHVIGIHTYSHIYKDIYDSVNSYLDDFAKTYDIIYETTGVSPSIFRFPGGSNTGFNEDIRKELVTELNRRGFTYYDWNVSSGDASSKNYTPDEIENNILSTLKSDENSIVLMHDTDSKKSTSLALNEIINGIKKKGYEMDKLDNTVYPVQFYYPDD